MSLGRSRLYQRVFLLNAAIFVAATLALVITPATISFPVELTEALVLVVGLAAIVGLNAFVLRAAFAPLERLTRAMRQVDPRRPGARPQQEGPEEVRELVAVFNDMLDRIERERRDSGRLAVRAQEAERLRVAQDLHDEVGQLLTGILVRLELIARRAPSELVPDVRVTQEETRNAIDHVTRVARRLRPEALADLGLSRALVTLGARTEEQSGLRVRSSVGAGLGSLGEERELVLYRVAQESLTNAARHAHATTVELALERAEGAVVLRVRDDGVGLPASLARRHGILGMQERALLIGATLAIRNSDPGVEVELTVPLEP